MIYMYVWAVVDEVLSLNEMFHALCLLVRSVRCDCTWVSWAAIAGSRGSVYQSASFSSSVLTSLIDGPPGKVSVDLCFSRQWLICDCYRLVIAFREKWKDLLMWVWKWRSEEGKGLSVICAEVVKSVCSWFSYCCWLLVVWLVGCLVGWFWNGMGDKGFW